MSEQECRIDHFRVTLVAKAFCQYASSLKFCQTSGKFSHVDEVLSFLSMYVAAPRVLWLLRALQDCDRHVDLLSTVSRVGGCKPSSLSRDTRYLAKDYSSELQACFGVDVRSDVASVHSPFTCVVCHRLLVAPPSLKARAGRDSVCLLC